MVKIIESLNCAGVHQSLQALDELNFGTLVEETRLIQQLLSFGQVLFVLLDL